MKKMMDKLDQTLAKELEMDARQSNRTLARKLDISTTTVQRRVQRLLDEKIITIATSPNPLLLGFPSAALIGVNVMPMKAGEVVERLRSCGRIQFVVLTTGRYDMLMLAPLRKPSDVIDVIEEDLGPIPYLVRVETMIVLQNIKWSWNYLNKVNRSDSDRDGEPLPNNLDKLDLELVKELELSPRESVKNLGEKLGVHRNIVGKRLHSLLADNVIRVVSFAEPSLFGFDIEAAIFVKVQPSNIRSVANGLVAERRVRHINIISGPFELVLNAFFQNISEMSDFLMNRLGSHPGVISHETLIYVASAKSSYSLLA